MRKKPRVFKIKPGQRVFFSGSSIAGPHAKRLANAFEDPISVRRPDGTYETWDATTRPMKRTKR